MKPIKFEQSNIVFGENQQEEYIPLPAHHAKDTSGTVTTCWELSPEEIEQVKKEGKIYLRMLTFYSPLQPVMLLTQNPLEE